MKAAELLVRCLEREGVEIIFGIPGEENIDVMDALLDSGIRFITTRHEQGAAFMADVHGRLTGKAGVCLATLGPGATNLVTGIADANMDRAPVVALAGQAETTRMHKESHQHLDLVHLFEPISKYATQIREAGIIPEVVRKAFKVAAAEKPGASFVELPENVAEAEVAEKAPLTVQAATEPYPAPRKVRQAAEVISSARAPIIMAGNGVIRGRACAELVDFAERLNIPVATTFMAKGAIPFSHPLSLGTVGLQAQDYVGCGFNRADVILCVGYDMVEYHPRLWHPSRWHACTRPRRRTRASSRTASPRWPLPCRAPSRRSSPTRTAGWWPSAGTPAS
jgi:acetolactate synthase-1/2/3 large subunit